MRRATYPPTCPRCGLRDLRPRGLTSRRVTGLFVLAFLILAMHWLLSLLTIVCGVAFYLTTIPKTCPHCGCDPRDDARHAFALSGNHHDWESVTPPQARGR